jgi:PBP1b-binding outer membrane lipoprotein LpoB
MKILLIAISAILLISGCSKKIEPVDNNTTLQSEDNKTTLPPSTTNDLDNEEDDNFEF